MHAAGRVNMDAMQYLPSFDIQHDTLEVFEDVAQDTVEQESIWISCYKENQSSVHGKVKLKKTGEGLQGVSLSASEGIRAERQSHRTFQVEAPVLAANPTLIRFPRATLSIPDNADSSAPLGLNVIAISSSNDQIVYGGPDGYCYVQEISEAGPSSERKTTKLNGHVGDVLDVKWFPSGQVVLTASSDATVRIFSSSSGVNPRTLTGHKRAVTSVAILGIGKNVLSGSKDGSLKLWDVGAGKCISTMYNKSFVGVEAIAMGQDATSFRGAIRSRLVVTQPESESDLPPEGNFEHKHMDGEVDEDTRDKIAFAGLSSGSGLLAAFDLGSKRPIIEAFPHIPAAASSIPAERRGGAIHAVAYDSKNRLLASGSAKGVVVIRNTRTMTVKGDSSDFRIFSRSQAAITSLTFVTTEAGVDLVVTTASGLPYRVKISPDGSEPVSVLEEYAGWEAVPVNSVAVGSGEGNVWLAGGEGGVRRY